MKPRPKLRKALKWSTAAATVLFATIWLASARWVLTWRSGQMNEASIGYGHIYIRFESSPSGSTTFPSGWSLSYHSRAFMQWRFEISSGGTINTPAKTIQITDIFFPLWIPTTIALTCAAVAWRLDTLARRRERIARGHCPTCNYNRAGIAANAACPECGKPPA